MERFKTRRGFLLQSLAHTGLFFLYGCGTNPAPTTGGDCETNGTSAGISGNHGHTLTVSAADVTTGVEKTYDIAGSSGHSHSVTLTAEHFSSLQAGTSVSVNSTSGSGHTHTVTVTCA